MKTGLLGCVNNITQNLNKIKVWARSFQEVCNSPIVLVCINPTEEELILLNNMGIDVSPYWLQSGETVNNFRLKFEMETLKKLDWDYALITDVFDVMFQDNPFTKIIGHQITVGVEGIYHSEEPWNLDVMKKSYPNKVELVRDKLILCSGVIGGEKKRLMSLLTKMDVITRKGEGGHDIRDQAAMNIKIWDDKSPLHQYNILTPKDGWVLHCAVGGPTQFYESWGFQKKMKERWGEADMVGGVVINGQNKIFDIVHQFNRIEKWNKELTTRYLV